MDDKKRPTLFVSHPSSQADTALHIERALAARGVNCWIAPRDIEPGEQWDIAIHHAINATDGMLLLFCEDSDRSKQVKRELILADQSDKSIIPMRLERIEPRALSYHLADSQWIDWIEQRDEAIDRIAAKARHFYSQRQGAEAEAAAPVPPAVAASLGAYDPPASPAPPPFQPPQWPPAQPGPAAPDRTRMFLWIGIGGLAAIIAVVTIIMLVSRGPGQRQLTAEWFAGTWSETRDCQIMYRFDRSGQVTDANGNQGRWRVEENNMLVVEGLEGTERRQIEILSDDHVTGPDGNAYRCFAGAT